MQKQVLLKEVGGLALCLFFFFQGLSFSNLEITLFFVKLSYVLEENHIFMKKVFLSCLKKILKISHKDI